MSKNKEIFKPRKRQRFIKSVKAELQSLLDDYRLTNIKDPKGEGVLLIDWLAEPGQPMTNGEEEIDNLLTEIMDIIESELEFQYNT